MPDATPPVAPQRPTSRIVHGVELADEYAWLRDRSDPATLEYLEAENQHTTQGMAATVPLQKHLYLEMLARIEETDMSVPERRGDWLYYIRTEEGLQYPIHCRRPASAPEGESEQIVLDQNRLAEGSAFHSLGAIRISDDHRLVAYSEDRRGDEVFTLLVADIDSGEILDRVEGIGHDLEWDSAATTLYYTMLDDAHRPWRVMRHELGGDASRDVELMRELDERFHVHIGRTRSRAFLAISSDSTCTSEVRLLACDDPQGTPFVLAERQQGIEYSVDHQGDRLLVATNQGARDFRLLAAPTSPSDPSSWQELVGGVEGRLLEGCDAFDDHIVLTFRQDATLRLRVWRISDGEQHDIDVPGEVFTVHPSANPEYRTSTLRFTYTSPVTPAQVWDYDMNSRERQLRKQQKVLGGFDPDLYHCWRTHAVAADGERIPISLVARRDRPAGGPALLVGYGAYGISIDPGFSSTRLSLLDRGWVHAIAHVRGGEELGRRWYEEGKLLAKPNTFTDFISCAEHLIAEGLCQRERLAISGGSAGGLLVGAVLNRRPDLCGAAIADVPFVDVLNTMLDPSIPLTIIEYEQWGDPGEREYFEAIRNYSPYDNIVAESYPAMLVLAGLEDTRVHYWEPAKWVARLRARARLTRPLYLWTRMGAGHSGASGRYEALEELAMEYAFLLSQLGEG